MPIHRENRSLEKTATSEKGRSCRFKATSTYHNPVELGWKDPTRRLAEHFRLNGEGCVDPRGSHRPARQDGSGAGSLF